MFACAALFVTLLIGAPEQKTPYLPTGKLITPLGKSVSVGSYPVNMVATADGKYAVVSDVGFRQFLSVVSLSSGEVVDQMDFNGNDDPSHAGLYYGLAVDPLSGVVYVSTGAKDKVLRFKVSPEGKLASGGDPISLPSADGRGLPWHVAGLALSSDGKKLVAVANQTNDKSDFRGEFFVFDTETGSVEAKGKTAGFPMACALKTRGENGDRKLYVASERDAVVEVFDVTDGHKTGEVKTGAAPEGLLFDADQSHLFVSNSQSDTVSFVDTKADLATATVLLRPSVLRGIQGATPTGMALAPDGKTLYVALQDMNAVAAVDVESQVLKGTFPVGWLPTSLVAGPDKLFVANAKGTKPVNPNNKPLPMPGLKEPSQYDQDLIDGSVSSFPYPSADDLAKTSENVVANNRLAEGLGEAQLKGFSNPGIQHVIYVIKENRTYDNVLGDVKRGNGDPSICLFPQKVSPNQHALVDRFALLDNFHVSAEVSQDGWSWSTSGTVNAYASRNTPYNYSGRGRNYDTEGSNNNIPVELLGIPDVTAPIGGYVWDACQKLGVSYRNYGFFAEFENPKDKRFDKKLVGTRHSTKKALSEHSDDSFRPFDSNYADSTGYDEAQFTWDKRTKPYGEHKATSRFQEWKTEFDQFVKDDNLPKFEMVRLGNDHTQGTRKGVPTTQSAVADNDYAVGELVDAVSHSKYWKDTAIFILEDDAQDGYDHVDCHRSTAYVVSPYVKKGILDSAFYNTDSVLRTMELLLGLPPMNQYDAVASPLAIFSDIPSNDEPYVAVKPDKGILLAVNGPTAFRSKDSSKINPLEADAENETMLNAIIWGSVMGPDKKPPKVRRN